VDVYDGQWQPVSMPFRDPSLPHGYAPFGIRAIQNVILVTYALQDEDKEDDVPGPGHGFVDAYDHFGRLLARVASGGVLNSPWGLALAPADFGKFSSRLLIGNFGNGRIHAFGLMPHATSIGALTSCDGHPLVIDGLWAIDFGNDAAAGPHSTLYFTAGPDDEENGLFGSIAASTCSHRMGTH
jgi:uncharacterized protein (TIGR03118 family)